jgi:UDPglucose 6-dehydrogenase
MKIGIVGLGHVGLANAILLAQHNEVVGIDCDAVKVNMVNARQFPIEDSEIESYLAHKTLNLRATLDKYVAYAGADFVVITVPTDYDDQVQFFDTRGIESVVEDVLTIAPQAVIVIKSTVPIGYTAKLVASLRAKRDIPFPNVIFSPEFLREGKALRDNLYPTRIVVGEISERAKLFATLMQQGAIKQDVDVLFTNGTEAEAIKLFANAYLAMRVAYFNELDTFAVAHRLNIEKIIQGVCLDPRIGRYYNNPSFGYGGYCLPKDTKQLVANFNQVPQTLMEAIISSNQVRKEFIATDILEHKPKVVGIYRLIMKAEASNYRSSSMLDIIKGIKARGVEVIVYEPTLTETLFWNSRVVNDLLQFKNEASLIVANRIGDEISDVAHKVYSRDLYGRD